MKKNLLYGLFLGVFLALCLPLSLGLFLAGPSESAANEQLSQAPKWKNPEGKVNTAFFSDLENWVNDRFFLRQELISLDHWLTANVLHTSAEPEVILGTDGWLYYANTLEDYTGIDPATDREIFAMAKNLELMQGYVNETQDGSVVFMIAPNKNSLYPENMPDYGVTAEFSDAKRLMERLNGTNVICVDLFETFGQQEEVLYFAHDSHWNSKGAALAADVFNAALGRETDYFGGDYSQTEPHDGDLYAMLYPGLRDGERNPVYGGGLNYTITSKATRPDAIVLTTGSQENGPDLLVYRDSFGNLLYPYLADSYDSVRFSRSETYDLTLDTPCVLIELVERNLTNLITNVPVMESPEREMALPAEVRGTAQVSVAQGVKTPDGCKQLRGTLPEAPDTESEIYVVCGETIYEAFCLEDDGFAANIPDEAEITCLVYAIDGKLSMFETKLCEEM